jgi:hypothetical protein
MTKIVLLLLLIAVPTLQQGTTRIDSSVTVAEATQGSGDLPPMPPSVANTIDANNVGSNNGVKGS